MLVPGDARTWQYEGWKTLKNLKTTKESSPGLDFQPHLTIFYTNSLLDRVNRTKMGNTAARQRLKAQDFAYISRNTAFLSRDVSSKQIHIKLINQPCEDCIGLLHRADVKVLRWQNGARGDSVFTFCHIFIFIFMLLYFLKEFKKIFRLAFPERPEDKLELLTMKVANVEKTDGKIREIST